MEIREFKINFQPLLLTEKILLKYGFEAVGDVNHYYRYKDVEDCAIFVNTGNKLGSYNIRALGDALMIYCDSLQDLQNKFYTITGKELKEKVI